MTDYINQNVAAYHIDRKATETRNLRESNPGIGFERDDGETHQMVGAYKNSINKNSAYALFGYTPFQIGDYLRVGIVGGAVTGYEKPVAPAAGLLATYQGDNGIGANIMVTPNVPKQNVYGFIGLQLRYAMENFLKD
ncbi:MAG TPA: hypothetical protein VK149_12345 [Sideroxyarcus sp.]|nr:hypothetical protein [Sideroxyarcus sp.]